MEIEIPLGAEIVRVHRRAHDPIFFGPKPGLPPANRFDARAGEYRVLYAARDLPGAFVETVLRRPGRILRRAEADERTATTLITQRALKLAKIYDEGLHWHGIHAGEISDDDYAGSRRLALELHRDFPDIDGLAYRSRFDNGQICYALFDRVNSADLRPAASQDSARRPP